jgi:3-oxoacyl-[acyl-carrier protein] reductase
MERSDKLLNGKVAFVTGASRGIGRSIAQVLADEGACIAVCSRSLEGSRETAEMIRARGGEAYPFQAHVADAEAVASLVNDILEQFGRIDILVNNAGITADNLLLRLKESDWDAVIDTNLKGTFNCTKAVARAMIRQRGGKIINISSVVGLTGNPGQANYCASKAGIIGFTKAVARELASRNITVNCVAPGYINTAMTSSLPEKAREEILKLIPLGRLGEPEDVAEIVKFLASPAADYVTGEIIRADGGMAM